MHRVTTRPGGGRGRAAWSAALSIAVLLAALVTWGHAQGEGFAELEVVAYGAQRFDLATGFTELVDGGEVVERGTGVRLAAPWLRYAEGDRLEAVDAVVEGDFGRIDAPGLALDIARRTLLADGGVRLVWQDGAVEADRLRFEADAGWLWVEGSVRGESPTLEAAEVGYRIEAGVIVLLPPYRFVDGPIVLSADADGAPLQLTPDRDADGALLGFDASTTLRDDVREVLHERREVE
jgi:hypothetical protein